MNYYLSVAARACNGVAYPAVIYHAARCHRRQLARARNGKDIRHTIHFTSKSCVLLWQRYYTAFEQWAPAKLQR